MSYDLLVFEASAAPSDPAAFLAWYEALTEWREGHSYDDPTLCGPALRAWFLRMIETFPALNGPFAGAPDKRTTDYSIARTAIYVGFSNAEGGRAYTQSFELARKCGLGFYGVSETGAGYWRPTDDGGYAETSTAGVERRSTRAWLNAKFPNARMVSSDTPGEDYLASLLANYERQK